MERGDTTADRQSAGFFGGGLKKGKRRLLVTLFGPDARESRRQAVENDAVDTDATVQRKTPSKKDKARKLNAAIQRGDVEELRGLINEETVDNEISECMRLSDLAAALGNTQFLQLAIELDAKINSKNSAGQVPIHYAFTSPDPPATVAFLLENGASTSIQFPNGDFLMHKACSDGATVLLELLLGYEADLNCIDHMKLTPLHRACINDLKDHAEIVIQAAPHLVNQQDTNGRSPLHIAVANQSIQLMKILLDRGAAIDKETSDGLTPIDLMMTSKNRGALRELIFYFTDKVSKDVKAHRVQELYRSKHFHKFLSLLQLIDSETHKCYYRFPDEHLQPEQELKLVEALLDLDEEHTQDVIEFQSRVMSALATEAIHDYTDNREIIDTIAIFTTKYILFREDVSLLQSVMKCGVLWEKVSSFLEQHIGTLYSKTSKDSSVISKLFTENFLEFSSGGKKSQFKRSVLASRIGDILGMYNLTKAKEEHCLEVGNPIDTLIIWSILTGKLNLTMEFMSRKRFEIVPLCLMAAGLLRNLPKVFKVDRLELSTIVVLADQCEMLACKIVDRIAGVDISGSKRITYQYLLQPMPAFGGLTCIHLAANCSCDTFLRMEICQKAMDVAWYRFLLDLNPIYREAIILLGAIPFNPIVSLALYRDYVKSRHHSHARKAKDKVDSGMSQRNSKTSFVIGEEEQETVTMFTDDLEFRDDSHVASSKLSECWSLYYYFYQIPGVKFRYFTISHIVLLLTLSYVVQFELNAAITPLEIFVYITAFGFLLEEIKKLAMSIYKQKLLDYARNKWNVLDSVTSLCFLLGFILRLIILESKPINFQQTMDGLFNNRLWYSTRFCLSSACLLYWLKLLNLSRVHEYFGPKLKMIYNMIIRDLIPFLFILIIFLFGFGILMCSLLYPNGFYAYNDHRLGFVEILKNMMKICFFSIFGEYHLDSINGQDDNCVSIYSSKENNTLSCPNPQAILLVPYILLPIYVTITTILLLSLIVALFSKTIEEIDSNSTALWQFERFAFITEYENYSSLPPPINVFDMSREAFLTVFHRYLPPPQRPVEMDFFNQEVTLRNLINQSIAMRNARKQMVEASLDTREAKAATVGITRTASLFRRS